MLAKYSAATGHGCGFSVLPAMTVFRGLDGATLNGGRVLFPVAWERGKPLVQRGEVLQVPENGALQTQLPDGTAGVEFLENSMV